MIVFGIAIAALMIVGTLCAVSLARSADSDNYRPTPPDL